MSSGSSPTIQERERDEAGDTYADSGSETSAPDTTPSERLQRLEAFSTAAKRRVDAVTANTENRCLITNCLPHHAADYAHLLSRAAKDSELTRLEFSWGMRRGTLNVDTHFNIVRLRRDVHALFDKGGFILLPEDDVVEKYMKGGKPDFNGDRTNNVRYKYTLVASPETDGYPLHRLRFPAQPGESRNSTNYLYPFAGFPALQSHVHPCFAICHAGRFKPNLCHYVSSTSHDLYFRLSKVMFTFSRWTTARPSVEFLNDPKLPTDRDDSDRIGDDDTHSNREDDASYRRSLRLQNNNDRQGSPSEERRGSKRQPSDNQRDCHGDTRHEDSRGLRALKAEIHQPHTYKRKREFVRDWVSSVVGQTFVEDNAMVSQKNQTCDVPDKGVNAFKGLHYTPPDISAT